jgi:hypothetical protein
LPLRSSTAATDGDPDPHAVESNPVTQYADGRNLRARQRLWEHESPPFSIVGCVLDLAGIAPGVQVLDGW